MRCPHRTMSAMLQTDSLFRRCSSLMRPRSTANMLMPSTQRSVMWWKADSWSCSLCQGPVSTAAKSSVDRDCQEQSPFDSQILGHVPEVFELPGLHSGLLHLNLDIPLIRQSGNESAAKVFELIGAMDMEAAVVTEAHCFRDQLLFGEGRWPCWEAHGIDFRLSELSIVVSSADMHQKSKFPKSVIQEIMCCCCTVERTAVTRHPGTLYGVFAPEIQPGQSGFVA